MGDIVLQHLDASVLTITINRAASKNSLSMQAARLLQEAIRMAELSPDVRVIIITGSGDSFCSGGDFKNFGAPDPGDPQAVKWHKEPNWNEIEAKTRRFLLGFEGPRLLHTMAKPTIAMLRGPAVGAGVGLAAACDFRFLADSAYFLPGYIRVGLSPDYGTSYYVTKLIGPAKARELYLLGDKVSAQEALRIGLATRVVNDADLERETMEFARRLADGPPVALQYTKEAINAAEARMLEDVLLTEARNFARCFQTEDAKEAVRAHLEKRAAIFKGR